MVAGRTFGPELVQQLERLGLAVPEEMGLELRQLVE